MPQKRKNLIINEIISRQQTNKTIFLENTDYLSWSFVFNLAVLALDLKEESL